MSYVKAVATAPQYRATQLAASCLPTLLRILTGCLKYFVWHA